MPIKPHAYASLYPGVDHLPARLPRLDRYGHAWCILCSCRNGHAVAGDGLCDECRGRNVGAPHPARYGHGVRFLTCGRCWQTSYPVRITGTGQIPPAWCDPCREAERAPQGETVRLFQPAPAQMPGQTSLDLA